MNAFWLEPPAEAMYPDHPTGLVPVDDLTLALTLTLTLTRPNPNPIPKPYPEPHP